MWRKMRRGRGRGGQVLGWSLLLLLLLEVVWSLQLLLLLEVERILLLLV